MTNPDPSTTPNSADDAGRPSTNVPPPPASGEAPTAGAAASGAPLPPDPVPPAAAVPPGAPPYGSVPPGAPPWSPSPWLERPATQPPGLVVGVILVAVGCIFLALRLGNIALGPNAWPLWLIVPGLAMVAGSLFIPSRGALGLAIPGALLAIVGGILWVQDAYGLYATWAYAWALVAPTGPGLAMLLLGAVRGDGELARDGLRMTLTGLGLFLGFGLFFEGVVGVSGHRIDNLDVVLPYAAIGLGALLIVLAFLDPGHGDSWRDQRRAARRADRDRRRAEKAARRAAR
jgi:hypothetical protein